MYLMLTFILSNRRETEDAFASLEMHFNIMFLNKANKYLNRK